jgi:ribosomal protein S18 acetylase RimI-like enzyme
MLRRTAEPFSEVAPGARQWLSGWARALPTNQMKISRRKATANDFDFLLTLHKNALGKYIIETYGPWDDTWQRERLAQRLGSGAIEILQVNSRDVGIIEIFREPDRLYLSEFEIVPELQRFGLGSSVLGELIAEARALVLPIDLQVFKVNPAQRLYERFGFFVIGETPTHHAMRWTPNAS